MSKKLERLHTTLKNDHDRRMKTLSVTMLSQSDFTNGSYVISTPGIYRLSENIVFNPNNLYEAQNNGLPGVSANPSATPYETGDPTTTQFATYNPRAFGIGFFAALVVQTSDVVIDLNNFSIAQSLEHRVQQSFYAHIELADQPFIPKQGPHNFGNTLISATDVSIINGVLGASAHHHIHGNLCKNIYINNIDFIDYEVAALALNGATNVIITHCDAKQSKHDVPLLGIYSSARFLRSYINALSAAYDGGDASLTIDIAGATLTATQIKTELKKALDTTYDGIVNTQVWWNDVSSSQSSFGNTVDPAPYYKLFHNVEGVVDGNSYGFLINAEGVAVKGFPINRKTTSQNIYFNDVLLDNHVNNVIEVPAFRTAVGVNKPQIDARGSVFQTQNKYNSIFLTINNSEHYLGNPVTNAQLLVAKHKAHSSLNSLDTTRLSISADTLAWAAGITTYTSHNLTYLCNGDSMFHVNKGAIGFKIDAAECVVMENCKVYNLENKGVVGSTLDGNYEISQPDATLPGYNGANSRGFSFSSSRDVHLIDCIIDGCTSNFGESIGYDIMHIAEDISLTNCVAKNIISSVTSLVDYDSNPTPTPNATGIRIGVNTKKIKLINFYSGEGFQSQCTTIPAQINSNIKTVETI